MTYLEICQALKGAGIENYDLEARLLIEELCGSFSDERDYASDSLTRAVEKRCSRYPLQYIIGKWWLARCEFEVNSACLIPRPDTETLIELASKLLPKNARFADLCTGSGCIAISVLDLREDTEADAYELYPETLEIAKRNAERNRVNGRFHAILGDVLAPGLLRENKYSAILSNPPYIRSEVVGTLSPEVLQEPRAALDGGEDGLIFYRAILQNFSKNLDVGGFFLFEIGYDQGEDLTRISAEHGYSCEIFKDLGGCDRCALLRKLTV